jgi:hypothetical protein
MGSGTSETTNLQETYKKIYILKQQNMNNMKSS